MAILSPFRLKGKTSTNVINNDLRNLINPANSSLKELKCKGVTYREKDRVIQTKNTEKSFNGDVGTITRICEVVDADGNLEKAAFVLFDGFTEPIEFTLEEMESFTFAYAITIHRSQGSEYKSVIIPFTEDRPFSYSRNLLYTAITRAKEKVTICGTEKAIGIATSKTSISNRNTILADRIHAYYNVYQNRVNVNN